MAEYTAEVLSEYDLGGSVVSCERHGCGHINETYLVVTEKGRRFILQKINESVFRDVDGLMANITAVTEHLRVKSSDPRSVLDLIKSRSGESYIRRLDGTPWRLYNYVEGAVCLQQPETPSDFYESAVAFGRFQELLRDFPADTLKETIPNFHNTQDRYRLFHDVLREDPLGRAKDVSFEIEFALEREKEASLLVNNLKLGNLPLRVTHNDTKFNNVMFDEKTRKAICVIDLDTVMPGLSLYDFGDAIRFGTASAAEDEKDLSRMEMRLDMFEIYTKGYLTACQEITPLERELLPEGARIMTLECGLRFLTDYIAGDKYFRIHREGHNLDRCRTQFKLVADIESKRDEMGRIVRDITKGCAIHNGNEKDV